jgi:PAS domain-containing protein
MATLLHAVAFLASASVLWRVRRVGASSAHGWFFVFVAAVAWWALFATLASAAPSAQWHLIWVRLAYLGIAAVPVGWFAFVDAFTFTGGPRRLRVALLGVVPIVTAVLAAAAPDVDWMLAGATRVTTTTGTAFVLDRGPWYWYVHLPYTYGLLLAGALRLVAFGRGATTIVRRQVSPLLVAIAVPVVGHLVTLTGAVPSGRVDLTVVGFAVAAMVIMWALATRRFLAVPPGAYRTAFAHVDQAVLIVDARERVIDANPAAVALFGLGTGPAPPRLGRLLPTVAAALRQLPPTGGEVEVRTPSLPTGRATVAVTPLSGEADGARGFVLVIRDEGAAGG